MRRETWHVTCATARARRRCTARARRSTPRSGIKRALNNLGEIARDAGRYDEARDYYGQSLALKRQIGDQWGISLVLHNLGETARDSDQDDQARDYYQQSLALKRQIGDRRGTAHVCLNLG